MRHAIEIRCVNGRMAVTRHVAVPLVIGENNNEVELLFGQRLSTKTKRRSQTKRTQLQPTKKKGVHGKQVTKHTNPLEEKETKHMTKGLFLNSK